MSLSLTSMFPVLRIHIATILDTTLKHCPKCVSYCNPVLMRIGSSWRISGQLRGNWITSAQLVWEVKFSFFGISGLMAINLPFCSRNTVWSWIYYSRKGTFYHHGSTILGKVQSMVIDIAFWEDIQCSHWSTILGKAHSSIMDLLF